MKSKNLRKPLSLLILVAAACSLGACSTDDVASRQDAITDAHESSIDRREARRNARDERMNASRESWMN